MPLKSGLRVRRLLFAVAAAVSLRAGAAADDAESFAIHGQATYVEQESGDFSSPYSGRNSLTPNTGAETADAGLDIGARLWRGAELWLDPEIDQGFGLDNTLGVAGFPSGEAYKVGKDAPYLRLPRSFVRQTLDLQGAPQTVAGAANQLAGTRSENRVVITLGKFAVGDVFDTNQYAHDPRSDFLNWAAIDAGTFDYAADAWGYTAGAALEWYQASWTLRAGFFDLSNIPNSTHLDPGFHEFQLDWEVEHRHEIGGRPGRVLLTVFDSRGRMGRLDQAVQLAESTDSPVDIAAVRSYRSRIGADVSLEQQLAADLGAFARIGKDAGNVEPYEFSDIDRTLATGLSLQGARWSRADDTIGLAGIINAISASREQYLNAGGLGILVGDGKLPHPGPELIMETYYSLALFKIAHLTLDYQWVEHPGYNRDRGPASIFAVRVHAQF